MLKGDLHARPMIFSKAHELIIINDTGSSSSGKPVMEALLESSIADSLHKRLHSGKEYLMRRSSFLW